MQKTTIDLRPISPQDGPALSTLFESSPDTGALAVNSRYLVNPYDLFLTGQDNALGVAARTSDGKLVGVCFVRFDQLRFDGHLRNAAFLHSIVTHPGHRRQGIAAQMTQWCIDRTQERTGPESIIYAGIQAGNIASFATVQKWLPETAGYFYGTAVPMRTRPPESQPDITVRTAYTTEFDEIGRQLNTFYQNHNFSPHETPETLQAWLDHNPFDTPFRHYHVAVDTAGNLLAGLGLTESYRATELHILRMPAYMHLLNKILHVVPQNGVMRRLGVSKLWFAPNQHKAAQFLWETIRWQQRDKGNSLMVYYDPTSPTAAIPKIPFWMPKAKLTLVVNSLAPVGEAFPIYPP